MVLAVPDEPARKHWGDSNRIAPGKVPVLRDELTAVVAKQHYPCERLRKIYVIREGQVVLFRFPQTDQSPAKLRPALVLRRLRGPFDDLEIVLEIVLEHIASAASADFDKSETIRFYSIA
jgi:hypothetical protein